MASLACDGLVKQNPFMTRFDLQAPVVGAAMSGASDAELAGATARAGGFGFLGAARYTPDQIRQEYTKAMQLAQKSTASIGIGLLNFLPNADRIAAIIECKAKAAWLAAGSLQPHCKQLTDAGIPVIVQVNTLKDVEEAIHCGAAAIIAQGSEAGGHSYRYASTFSFVPEAVDLVQQLCQRKGTPPVPVLAAGGISDPRQAAAALALGAQAVILGTRLVATHECSWPKSHKQALVAAGSQAQRRPATTCTGVFDDIDAPQMQKAYGAQWPKGCNGRALQTPFTDKWGDAELSEGDMEQLAPKMAMAKKENNLAVAPVWAGASVGLITSIEAAEDVVKQFADHVQAWL